MLKTRIITALILFAVLLLVLYSKYPFAFPALVLVFFVAAIWENSRLFGAKTFDKAGFVLAGLWGTFFAWFFLVNHFPKESIVFGGCVAIWMLRLTPSLALGLPFLGEMQSRLLSQIYSICVLGCFVAIAALFKHSPVYLLSVLMMVWIADTGAYFSGKALGKRKLAPSISPGKSWEGAIGGWIAVLLSAVITIVIAPNVPLLADTFVVKLQSAWGWLAFFPVMTLIVAASVVGDLFESQLKRRAGMKDSSNLLPGHGGVLDRIDALIPVLPLAALLDIWFSAAHRF
jgi:phosphatidate cytidylyltransferase